MVVFELSQSGGVARSVVASLPLAAVVWCCWNHGLDHPKPECMPNGSLQRFAGLNSDRGKTHRKYSYVGFHFCVGNVGIVSYISSSRPQHSYLAFRY